MTALSVPARPGQDASPRPVPWRRMIWVTWRQHRGTLAGVAVFLGAAAASLWLAGLQMHHAYAAAFACRPVGSPACNAPGTGLVNVFNDTSDFLSNGGIAQLLPALVGAFAGAPLLARELETGTFRYAWTQGLGRQRWALAKLVLLGAVLAAAAGAFSVLLSWYYQPYFAPGNQALSMTQLNTFDPTLFNLRGITFAAWTLAAFTIGALAGLLIRRVIPAVAATLAVYGGLAFAAGGWPRQYYLPPLVTGDLNVPGSAWLISQWWTRGGQTVSQSTMYQVMDATFRHLPQGAVSGSAQKEQGLLVVERYLTRHGYTLWTSYQPASRFWPFQWIEGGWLLALSAALIAVTVWLVRRRAA